MITDDIERYVELRRSLGYKFDHQARNLRRFGCFAVARGDTHVRTATVVAWLQTSVTQDQRYRRLHYVIRFARFLRAEDPLHEVPSDNLVKFKKVRPSPYIYTADEILRMIDALRRMRWWHCYRFQPKVYGTLIGLLAATGMRISEALNLRLDDILDGKVLRIKETKFCKSRLVPLHSTAAHAVHRYLEFRRHFRSADDHLFLSAKGTRLSQRAFSYVFCRIVQFAGLAPGRKRRPRIHDLRHTFATRVLEQCAADRDAVARHFVALATYLGHVDMVSTYWYLEATPELMTDISSAAEVLVGKDVA